MATQAGRRGEGVRRGLIRQLIVVGDGRVGLSIAADLGAAADLRVTVVGRSPERPPFLRDEPDVAYLADGLPAESFVRALHERLGRASHDGGGRQRPEGHGPVLVFCVADDQLAEVSGTWQAAARIRPAAALHTSGVHSAEALAGWSELGVPVAAWHPLVAVAAPRRGAFAGVWFGTDGEVAAVRIGEELARRLGGRAHAVRPEARAHYHAAGVFASNYLVACLRIALEELRQASDEADLAALLPLAESAIRNLKALGLPEGATGPVVRGDVRTVLTHLAVLDPGRATVYRGLGEELLALAGNRLDPEVRARLAEALSDPSTGTGGQETVR